MSITKTRKKNSRFYWAELGFLALGLVGLNPTLLTDLLIGSTVPAPSTAPVPPFYGHPTSPRRIRPTVPIHQTPSLQPAGTVPTKPIRNRPIFSKQVTAQANRQRQRFLSQTFSFLRRELGNIFPARHRNGGTRKGEPKPRKTFDLRRQVLHRIIRMPFLDIQQPAPDTKHREQADPTFPLQDQDSSVHRMVLDRTVSDRIGRINNYRPGQRPRSHPPAITFKVAFRFRPPRERPIQHSYPAERLPTRHLMDSTSNRHSNRTS